MTGFNLHRVASHFCSATLFGVQWLRRLGKNQQFLTVNYMVYRGSDYYGVLGSNIQQQNFAIVILMRIRYNITTIKSMGYIDRYICIKVLARTIISHVTLLKMLIFLILEKNNITNITVLFWILHDLNCLLQYLDDSERSLNIINHSFNLNMASEVYWVWQYFMTLKGLYQNKNALDLKLRGLNSNVVIYQKWWFVDIKANSGLMTSFQCSSY